MRPLAESYSFFIVLPCDVTDDENLDAVLIRFIKMGTVISWFVRLRTLYKMNCPALILILREQLPEKSRIFHCTVPVTAVCQRAQALMAHGGLF